MTSVFGNGALRSHRFSDLKITHQSKRPVYSTNGALVPPSDINDHRLSHKFLGPGCLCALRDPSESAFTEAAVFMVVRGRFSGKYVAACAQEKCGYLGKYPSPDKILFNSPIHGGQSL